VDVSRNIWREPNTQLQYHSYRLAVASAGADTDIFMMPHQRATAHMSAILVV
jgi:hypothetical protein